MPLPSLFIPHGAGPCFFMRPEEGFGDMWNGLGQWLRDLNAWVKDKPKAILVVSAHWQTQGFAVTAAAQHSLLYDYSGFPLHTYALKYPASGDPALASKIAGLLNDEGLSCGLDDDRGLDHGAFIPLMLAYPKADIPVLQLSLDARLDAATHYQVGECLACLREEGVLIIGSGMSFHNMRPDPQVVTERGEAFDQWLNQTLSLEAEARKRALVNWQSAPFARFAHPTEEHFMPLLTVCGAAHNVPAKRVYHERLAGTVDISAYQF